MVEVIEKCGQGNCFIMTNKKKTSNSNTLQEYNRKIFGLNV